MHSSIRLIIHPLPVCLSELSDHEFMTCCTDVLLVVVETKQVSLLLHRMIVAMEFVDISVTYVHIYIHTVICDELKQTFNWIFMIIN